jgi:tRNA(Arg) A34 adenosine deaminase TadA
MDAAIVEARKSELAYRLGCVAVASGKVVARGHNNYRTYSKDGLIDNVCSCHAEIDVLRKCLKQNITKKLTLYITRLSSNDELSCSAPCIDCFIKMRDFNIRSIAYVNHDGEITKKSFSEFQTSHHTSGYRAIKSKRVKCF